jgi:hypothetical protein
VILLEDLYIVDKGLSGGRVGDGAWVAQERALRLGNRGDSG